MSNPSRRISWNKTSNTTWDTKAHRTYSAQITYTPGPSPYSITILPGPFTSSHPTEKAAKNHYRKFLRDKPLF